MESYAIEDAQLTASSTTTVEADKYGTHSARLNGKFAWRTSSTGNEYIQVDLGEIKTLTAIATQGDTVASAWVTSFAVKYSADNVSWEDHPKVTRVFKF